MTALKAIGWAAFVVAFCAVVELMRRLDDWMRRHGLSVMWMGRAYVLVVTRIMQVFVIAFGIYGLVKILGG